MNEEDQEAAEWAQYENESRRFREDCDEFSREFRLFLADVRNFKHNQEPEHDR